VFERVREALYCLPICPTAPPPLDVSGFLILRFSLSSKGIQHFPPPPQIEEEEKGRERDIKKYFKTSSTKGRR